MAVSTFPIGNNLEGPFAHDPISGFGGELYIIQPTNARINSEYRVPNSGFPGSWVQIPIVYQSFLVLKYADFSAFNSGNKFKFEIGGINSNSTTLNVYIYEINGASIIGHGLETFTTLDGGATTEISIDMTDIDDLDDPVLN